jgi:hypothetical protein
LDNNYKYLQMKGIFLLSIISIIVLSGCASNDILCTAPRSPGISEDNNGNWTYENDTIRITYSFWAEKGVMAMIIQNKLNVPIYIDWKKSSYIDRGHKLDYYSEALTTKSVTGWADAPYLYKGPYDWSHWYPVNLGVAVSQGIIEKQERVSFIPPHSYNEWHRYRLLTESINMKNPTIEYISVVGKQSKLKVRVISANQDNARIFFSNYLTYSTKENFESEQDVDNQFYINKIMRVRQFWSQGLRDSKRFYIPAYDN